MVNNVKIKKKKKNIGRMNNYAPFWDVLHQAYNCFQSIWTVLLFLGPVWIAACSPWVKGSVLISRLHRHDWQREAVQILVSGPSEISGWKELRIRAASAAQRWPNALLYQSGVRPLKADGELNYWRHSSKIIHVFEEIKSLEVLCRTYFKSILQRWVSLDFPEPQGSSR